MKKRILSILLTLVLALSLCLVTAVPVGAVVTEREFPDQTRLAAAGNGIAEWVTTLPGDAEVYNGDFSAHMAVPADSDIANIIHMGIQGDSPLLLSQITTVEFWEYLVSAGGSGSGAGGSAAIILYLNEPGTDSPAEGTNPPEWGVVEDAITFHTYGTWATQNEWSLRDLSDVDQDWQGYVDTIGIGTVETLSYWTDTWANADWEVCFISVCVGSGNWAGYEGYIDDFIVEWTGSDYEDTYLTDPRIVNVTQETGHNYIQDAIDDADPSDTIIVAAGAYPEQVVIDKSLTLQGAEEATIAPTSGCGVEVQASDVTVDGFDINTSGVDAHGIWISVSATGLALTENDITIGGLSTAIYADAGEFQTVKSSGWLIQDNVLNAPAGCNLELYDVDAVTIDDNTFGNTLGSNVIVSSELFNLTGTIAFTNNDVQGNDGGSMVAFVTDFQQYLTTRDDVVVTSIDDVTITGNTFDGWTSRGLRIGDWGGDVTNVVVNNNNFLATGEALANQDAAELDAENNWWGQASGPGQGAVVGSVDVVPWLFGPIPESGQVTMTSSFTAQIGISVVPTSLDFGDVVPGVLAGPETVTVSNTGNVAVDLTASIANESPSNVYTDGLEIDTLLAVGVWGVTEAVTVEIGGDTGAMDLELTVPVGTAPGTYTAVLIFWAEQEAAP